MTGFSADAGSAKSSAAMTCPGKSANNVMISTSEAILESLLGQAERIVMSQPALHLQTTAMRDQTKNGRGISSRGQVRGENAFEGTQRGLYKPATLQIYGVHCGKKSRAFS